MSQNFQYYQVYAGSKPTPLFPVTAVQYKATSAASSFADKKVVQSTSQGNQDKEFEERSIQDKRDCARGWAGFYVRGMYEHPDNNTKVRYGLSKLEEQVLTDPNPCMSWDEFQALVKEEHRRNQKIHPELSYIFNVDDERDVSASSPMADFPDEEVEPNVSASSPLALDD